MVDPTTSLTKFKDCLRSASHLASTADGRSAVQLADTDASCSGPTALGTAAE